ncbi:trypsin-like serine protease [Rhizomonospora bruguierae]|uniref:trypsin-like serine protease n=1 Tax=Rhizomonospora bruguierae TaxID=1581705 RepID=UPI001BD02793|nr:trypsin-like serine protease [Micromonospora sp. NBRC 107566]
MGEADLMGGRRLALLGAATALLLVAPAATVASASVPGAVPRAVSSVEQAPGSVAYLRNTYRLSEGEALRRLDLQAASVGLANELAGRFPADFAGMWLDQIGGGVLRVGMVHPEKLGPAVAALPEARYIKPVRATRSLRQLTVTAQRLAAALGTTVGTDVTVDQPTNSVIVYTGDRIEAADPGLAAALGAPEERTQVLDRGAAGIRYKSCDPRYCAQAPMRGGIRLDVTRDDGTHDGCTTGFNLIAAGTGTRYVVTGGHCVTSESRQKTDATSHQLYGPNWPVNVAEAGLAENAFPLDYAVLPYQPDAAARWLPAPSGPIFATDNLVNFWCVEPGCAARPDVPITGYHLYSAVKVGWVVCATGSAYTPSPDERYVDSGAGAGYLPGTRCGEITGLNGGVQVRICARPGDSGGPLFEEATGKAIGILSFGDPGQGPCTNPDEHNSYAPISKILDRVNAQVPGRDFRLVTEPYTTEPYLTEPYSTGPYATEPDTAEPDTAQWQPEP